MLEPGLDISQIMNVSKMAEDVGEDWVQEKFINLPTDSNARLVDFFFMSSRMICIFEDFQVQEIDIESREVIKLYNLQEIEGFEISEDVEEDKVMAFALEKDVMLVSVACMTQVHVFEYTEEEEQSLAHVATIPNPDITEIVFVDYILVMVQDLKDHIKIMCWDPDTENTAGSIEVEGGGSTKALIQAGSECIYFTAGSQVGKIKVPEMSLLFKVDSGHKKPVVDFAVSRLYD